MTEFVSTLEEYMQPGESGESGENPEKTRDTGWRKDGENWRKLGEFAYESPDYPVEALGSLAEVCRTIADGVQINQAMVGQCLLTAASLITQGAYEVETLAGFKPLSVYGLTIADSGDGKSTAEKIVLDAIRKFEKEKHADYARKVEEAEAKASKTKATVPPAPYLIASDATVQGILRGFREGWPSQGAFTAEGATMLCGWGMSAEQRANSAANLNKLWDGEAVSIQRGMSGRTQLYNRRFCAHWLIQPDAAQRALMDGDLSSIGFWPRFLISWPEPIPPRKYRKYQYWTDPIVTTFWARCREILNIDILGENNECHEFRTIRLSDPARELLKKTFERMEQARDQKSPLHTVKPYAVRSCEQACRIAGVLTAYDSGLEISGETMRDAIKLTAYSLDTWRGIFGQREDLENERWAGELHSWMMKQPGRRATETGILRIGPRLLRSKHKRDVALSILQQCEMIRKAVDFMDGMPRIAIHEWEALDNA